MDDLNYLRIDGKNELKFISNENNTKELLVLYTSLVSIEDSNIGNGINRYINNLFPNKGKDKIIQSNTICEKYKEKFNNILNYLDDSVNRILSFNSTNLFIFNEKNITDLNNMLIYIFDLIKEYKIYKISNYEDLKSKIAIINNKKINVINSFFKDNKSFKTFVSNNSLKIKKSTNSKTLIDLNTYFKSNSIKSTTISNLISNKYSHQNIEQKYILPIELIIILNKFSSINKLHFVIYNTHKKTKYQILLILLNQEWIFPNVQEIEFDFNENELFKELNQIYKNQVNNKIKFRATNYDIKKKNKCTWNAFNEISLFNNYNENLISRLNISSNNEEFSDSNSNINPFFINDNLENCFDYIDIIKNKNQNIKNEYELSYNRNYEKFKDTIFIAKKEKDKKEEKKKKEEIYKMNQNSFDFSPNKKDKIENIEFSKKIDNFIELNSNTLEMIIIYSYFISLMTLNNLSLFFNQHFSNEIEIFLKNKKYSINHFHFLFFFKKINTLLELNLIFNSLDEESFEKIIYIIHKNNILEKLRISFFVPDINYSPFSLIKLYTGLNYNLLDLFDEQNKSISEGIDLNFDNTDIDLFLINKKLYESFQKNIIKLFEVLITKIRLKELILLFDTPIIININDKYSNLLIKFIINILIMISSNKKVIEVLKIISPFLSFDNRLFPSLDDLLILADNRNNMHLKYLTFQCKIYQCLNLYYIIPYKVKILFLGNLDNVSFDSFIHYYKSNEFLNQSELISIKINLNLNIILLDNVIESCIDYLKYSPKTLKEKVLLSNMKTKNTSIMKKLLNVFFFSPLYNIFISFSRSAETKYLNARAEINNDNKIYINTIIKYIISKKKVKEKKYKKEVINRIKNYLQIPINMNKKIFCGNKI